MAEKAGLHWKIIFEPVKGPHTKISPAWWTAV
jgi:hypothetical protein